MFCYTCAQSSTLSVSFSVFGTGGGEKKHPQRVKFIAISWWSWWISMPASFRCSAITNTLPPRRLFSFISFSPSIWMRPLMSLDLRLCVFHRILLLLLRTTSSPLNAPCADNPIYSASFDAQTVKYNKSLFICKAQKRQNRSVWPAVFLPVRQYLCFRL